MKEDAEEQQQFLNNTLNVEKNKTRALNAKLKTSEDEKIKMEQLQKEFETELR